MTGFRKNIISFPQHFVELAQQEKTQARIAHMLKTGKPLRN